MKIIYAIPGLATTQRLFQFTKISNCDIITLSWPQPVWGESMKQYAQRFIDQIDLSKPFSLMGVSFGGMLCIELSDMVPAEQVILISSCKTRKELPVHVRLLKYLPIHQILPEKILRKIAAHSRLIIGFDKKYENEFREMIYSMPENYMKICTNMIARWQRSKAPRNCIHIHGTKDRLLFFNCVKADHVITNGTHAMIVNDAKEINKLLSSFF